MAEKQLTFDPDIVFGEATKKRKKELLGHVRGLALHPGWAYIVQVLNDQAHRRYLNVGRTFVYTDAQVLEQAGLRGEAAAMELLAGFPDSLIQMFIQDLGRDPEKEEDEGDED